MLSSLRIVNLTQIKNYKGDIIKYVNKKNKFFKGFGEVYFNEINHGYEKGLNLHKKNQSLITVLYGSVTFTFYNKSRSKKKIIKISRSNPKLVIIPKNVWFKFKSNKKKSIIVNLINNVHDINETLKIPI